jgi:ABC-type microcin C transport system permease subunit YejB
MLMAIIALLWAATKNAVQEFDASLRADEIFQLVCVLYAERAFIIFIAIMVGVAAQSWWDSQALAEEEKENASIFWSGILKKAQWSMAISLLNVGIAVFAAQSTTDPPSTLALLFWVALVFTLISAVAVMRIAVRTLRTLPPAVG